ncbi:sugar isomerase domain-containing protein [Actinoallomurus acaciae]|uniref:Sugar isomerase domain-containing protein n=1 Tax=Actinoallomurus acaciae TaxID=502577 RepID=A0ABV5YL22_9ACTN
MPTGPRYTRQVIDLLQKLADSQNEALDRAATACADSLRTGNLIHLFGSGHSVIPTLDAFPRYGSFVGLHPLTDPRLMWHNVLGPGGVRELLWLERVEDYIDKFLDHEPLSAGDTLVCYSHGGTNSAAIEAAMYAGKRGITTVAVTSGDSAKRPAKHSSGNLLGDVCDVVIDTGVPVQDALIDIPGWDRPTGGSSTVLATVVSHELITRTAEICAGRGTVLPTFVSPTVPGASLASNDEVFAAHAKYLHAARGRALDADTSG